ncbi:MAG: alpha/beta hydrolase [Acidimicrobiales bacterium]
MRAPAGGSRVPIDAGEGPVVVLVHGQPGAGGDWVALAKLLSADHRVLAPDRPGWGSDPRPAMGMAANAEALQDLLEGVEAQSPLTVVGHSFGGGVALELALTHPERVGALVLVGSIGVAGALSGFDRLLVVPMIGEGILRAGVAALRRALITATRYSQRHPDARVAKKVLVLPTLQAAIGSDGRPMVGRSRQSFLVEQRALLAETPELERALGRIAVPTAVVTGASDRIVPVSAARSLAGRVPGAELVVMAGGHLLPFDQPEKVAEIVHRYSALASGVKDGRQRRETPEA